MNNKCAEQLLMTGNFPDPLPPKTGVSRGWWRHPEMGTGRWENWVAPKTGYRSTILVPHLLPNQWLSDLGSLLYREGGDAKSHSHIDLKTAISSLLLLACF